MRGKFARGWMLMRESWNVLRADRGLLVFPVLSFVAILLVLATFVVPLLASPGLARQVFGQGDGQHEGWAGVVYYGGLFLFYLATYFVIVFFNVALVSCALLRFRGGEPKVSDGLRVAASRLPQIAAWALMAASVGLVLRAIEDKVSWVGKLVVSLIGVAWSVVTYFVVPVLAVEQLGPMDAIRRSADLLKKTWGESLAGQFSLGLVNLVLFLPGLLLAGLGGVLAGSNSNLLVGLPFIVLSIVYFAGLFIVMSTVRQVFLAGTYLFAATGQIAPGFSEESLKLAFKPKRKR